MGKKINSKTEEKLLKENQELIRKLAEVQDTIDAIRSGSVDAIVVGGGEEEKLYTLVSADKPYRTIIEEMNEGAVTVTPEGVIMYCNKKFEEIINKPVEVIIGKNFSQFISAKDLKKFHTLFNSGLKSRSSGEIIFNLKDKTEKHIYLSLSPLPSDMLSGVCIIVTDITERKISEMKLKESHDILVKTQNQLIHYEKLASLGRFSTGIAHEIRNPLANISSLAQLLNKEKLFDPKFKKYVNYILVNTNIANRIIKDLLSFASPDSYIYKKFNIVTILEKLVKLVNVRCRKSNITIRKKFAKDLPSIKVNKEKLQTTFLNFISNAIDAMPKGGILTISADYDDEQQNVIITFEDSGIGIPETNLDLVLEPFFTTKKDGTGLGLSLAYNVVTAHGGKIEVESKVNVGTKFKIKLPNNPVLTK